MLRFVLDDYKHQLKSSFKNLSVSEYFIYLYMLIYPPLLFSFEKEEYFVYYGSMLPLCFGLLLSRMYPNQISKTLLLTPMTESEKRHYITTAFKLRITVPVILYLVLGVILIGVRILSPIYYLCMGTILIFFIISANIYCLPEPKNPNAADKTYHLPGNYDFWNILNQLTGIISMVIIVSAQTDKKNSVTTFDNWVIGICIFLEFIIFLKFQFTYYKPIMERAIKYENYY